MIVNKAFLEHIISKTNKWLESHPKTHKEYSIKQHSRNYYVNKLINMEELGFNFINV